MAHRCSSSSKPAAPAAKDVPETAASEGEVRKPALWSRRWSARRRQVLMRGTRKAPAAMAAYHLEHPSAVLHWMTCRPWKARISSKAEKMREPRRCTVELRAMKRAVCS
eukprot:6057355-Lingulodinium_polyedra.AAC.1